MSGSSNKAPGFAGGYLLGVFLGGLMIGRTPEYLGKKITSAETRWIALYILLTPMVTLLMTGIAVTTDVGRAGLVTNSGPRGLTEILFAYASCMANNGLGMAGLNGNTLFYNISTAIAMLAGRFGLAALALALAGRFAAGVRRPTTAGSLSGDTPIFAAMVFGSIVLVGALSFFPRWHSVRLWSLSSNNAKAYRGTFFVFPHRLECQGGSR